MSAPLDGIASYSAFVYELAERHPFVKSSTLALASIGATLAKLEGRVECQGGIHLEVWELIDFAARRIRTYSYEVYRGDEKICWYDSWEHPEIPALQSTFPHHKHTPPNLRDHRGARAWNKLCIAESGCRFERCSPGLALTVLALTCLRTTIHPSVNLLRGGTLLYSPPSRRLWTKTPILSAPSNPFPERSARTPLFAGFSVRAVAS